MLEKPKYKGASATILAVLCLVSALFRPLYSGDIDNYTMALVANKLFAGEGQDGYISYVHPILCKLFEGVHALLPKADCFTLTANAMLLATIWVLGYTVAQVVKNRLELTVCNSLIFAIVFFGDLFHDNFTRWAAFLSAVGAIILLLMLHQKLQGKKWLILSTIFISLGMMWRYEAMFLFVPYLALDFVVQVLFRTEKEARKQVLKKQLQIIFLPVLCLLVLFAGSLWVRNSKPYKEAVAYDDIRSLVLDYPIKAWEEVEEELPELSKNDYESTYHWVLLDTERVDTDFLTKMKKAGEMPAYRLSAGNLIKIQKSVFAVFLESRQLQYLCLLAGVLFVLIVLTDMAWYYKAEAFFWCLGTDLIDLFFAYRGRALERVYLSALYALLISLAILLLTETSKPRYRFAPGRYVLLLLACAGILLEAAQGEFGPHQSVFEANTGAQNPYEAVCQENELYFWRVGWYVKHPVQSFMEQGKLMPEAFMTHHMYDGAWIYGQVYFKQYLQSVGANNPMEALLFRENTYYVAEDCSYVLTYLKEHYDAKITADVVNQINGIPVWEFKRKEEESK